MEKVKKQELESLFVGYKQAVALKELGFDESCLGIYYGNGDNEFMGYSLESSKELTNKFKELGHISAPLYQQAFRWFRKEYKLSSHNDLFSINHLGENYYFQIINFADFISSETTLKVNGFKTEEEAESTCLDKLIEICKNK